MRTIFWAGDSTVQYNSILTYPQTGMGQVINLYLKPEVKVFNTAKNGRSTKSYLDEKRHLPIVENIKEGDIFLIQFGHNDEKIADPARYTEPYGAYQDNLRYMISIARDVNAYPVLITPLERKSYADGVLQPSQHTEYVNAMKQVAQEENVPLIDLFTMSRDKILEIGEQKAFELYMELPAGVYPHFPNGLHDNTHLKYFGAVVFAGMICRGLKELGGVYADVLGEWTEEEVKLV